MELHAKAAKFHGKKISLPVKLWRREEMCGAFSVTHTSVYKRHGYRVDSKCLAKKQKALNLSVNVHKNSIQDSFV